MVCYGTGAERLETTGTLGTDVSLIRFERSEAVERLERLERAAVLPGAKRLNDWNVWNGIRFW
jgi:hypothetical protein